jgi:menaquinol-cytochrome c reductase iron-sulfur subunit
MMKQNSRGPKQTRREFLKYVVIGGASAVAAAIATPLIGYFLSPTWGKRQRPTTAVTRTDQIPVGVPTFIRFEERLPDAWVVTTQSEGVWVVTKDGNNFTLFDPHCTHLRCPFYWDNQNGIFACPCHGGKFDIDGKVLAGPPPRPLDRWQFTIENGEIVTSGQIIRG